MDKNLIPIRLSHVLSYSGVGAIVQSPNGLLVIKDIRDWTDRHGNPAGKLLLYIERVRSALGITEELREPPVAQELKPGVIDGSCVPTMKFPSWMRCPNCGFMYRRPWQKQGSDSPHCTNCEKRFKLEQVTWIAVHASGYLADVPWHSLLHKEPRRPEQKQCKIYDKIKLLEHGGYANRQLKCEACGAKTPFLGNEYIPLATGPQQPWTKNDHIVSAGTSLKPAQVLAVNDARVYSPVTQTVLVIPPESRVRKGTVIDLLYRNSDDRKDIDMAKTSLAKKGVKQTLATKYRCNISDIDEALQELARGYPLYGENLTQGQLLESEFKAFLEILPDQRDDEDLVTRNQSESWHELGSLSTLPQKEQTIIGCIHQLVRLDRLKAVKVFKGFTRLGETNSETNIVPPDIVGQSDWLPAIELYGEGIFLTLDEARLQRWEQKQSVITRLAEVNSRFINSARKFPNPLTARFMLLHTLAHLLMRQIESEGGYPAASLTERIYCGTGQEPMAGILIYVAVPDVAGSLGGLAELSESQKFLSVLLRALEHAEWCSLDPVCSEHEGQGPSLLNRAACHACVLVPEPACEYGNTLLDRGFVKGDIATGLSSFFGDY